MRSIIDIQLRGLMKRLEDRKIRVELTDRAKDLLIAEGYDPIYGARPLKRTHPAAGARPARDARAAGGLPRGRRRPHRRAAAASSSSRACRARRGRLIPPAGALTRRIRRPAVQLQLNGRSDLARRPTRAARSPGDRRCTPRTAPGSTMWYVLGLPAAAGARPGVLLLAPVGRDTLLQRLQEGRSRGQGAGSHASATTASAAR